MLKQAPLVWSCMILVRTGCLVLQWCKKLLWSHCASGGSLVPMPMGSFHPGGHKHDHNTTGYDSPCMNHVWWLNSRRGKEKLVTPSCGYRPRKWSRPADLGGSLYPTIWPNAIWWVCCKHMLCNIQPMPMVGRVCFCGFVDNMDLCIAGQSLLGVTMADLMQHSIMQWEGLLATTGDALVLEKCFWYLLEFKQYNGQWKCSASTKILDKIQIRDANRQTWAAWGMMDIGSVTCTGQ